MLLDEACDFFGWPTSSLVLRPTGAGAAVCAADVSRRIAEPLKRRFPKLSVETGILASAPLSSSTATPLAIVCQFLNGASEEAIRQAHRLAWNFSGAALLIVLEPHRITAWSCHQDPLQSEETRKVCECRTVASRSADDREMQRQVRDLLHWVSLITGEVIRRKPEYFPADGRADRLLLKNLRHVRRTLLESGLSRDFCHDLLARVIFTQFLFHRKDSSGVPFFSEPLLGRLVGDGTLQRRPEGLASILQDRDETYALFRWLDGRFNGDLFPGKEDQSDSEREAAWRAEKKAVSARHLGHLAELVAGTIDTSDRQLRLWPEYSFETIPLEFVSSVYEEFLNEDRDASKAYYTPGHLVDYVLDAVLPWDGEPWDLRILDPACGSGIFLVKAFQRLIHRWRRAHDKDPLVSDLKPLLARSVFGVDINADAVRVASFSLYLAMADAIDPKHYLTREKVFPRLRGARLVSRDFFDERTAGIRSLEDAGTFDLVIGNAPWGDRSIKKTSDLETTSAPAVGRKKKTAAARHKAEIWADSHQWPITNHDIGPLFVAKGLTLLTPTGRLAMLQPAPPWLYQRARPADELRRRLFTEFTVDEVTNLSAVRRELFQDAIGPACIIIAGHGAPDGEAELDYFTPKPQRLPSECVELRIEPQDVARVTHAEAANDPLVWSVLALGGRRDLQLIRRLGKLPTLARWKAEGKVLTRMGVIPGDRKKPLPALEGKRYFEAPQFADDVFLEFDADKAPRWTRPLVNSKDSTDFEAFKKPQLLMKQTYAAEQGRFRAALVVSSDPEWGVICKKTYLSVRDLSNDGRHLASACLAHNSLLATYYLFLASSRLGHYIPEALTRELMELPLPQEAPDLSKVASFEEIDRLARLVYDLTEADWTLIDDLIEVALPDAIRKSPGKGRGSTRRHASAAEVEPELSAYGQTLRRVLQSTFGRDKSVACTIYQEPGAELLPVRMVTLHLDWPGRVPLAVEPIAADGLFEKMRQFQRDVLGKKGRSSSDAGIGFQRVARLIHSRQIDGARVYNVTIVKPDEYRYWTRSQAMRDADELVDSIFAAAKQAGPKR